MLNQKGSTVIEMIPVIIVLMVLLRYSYGFFGVIHTATVQSIASRNYSFETFRHRSRLNYLREIPSLERSNAYRKGVRLHGVADEESLGVTSGDLFWIVGTRDISFPSRDREKIGSTVEASRKTQFNRIAMSRRNNTDDGVDPVWIAVRYGMCIDYSCGD